MKQRIFDRETKTFVDVEFDASHRGDIPSAYVRIAPDDHHEDYHAVIDGGIMVSAAFNAIRAKNLPALIDIFRLFPHQSEATPK